MTTEAINRLSHEQLRQAVQLLMRAELTLKQDYGQSVSGRSWKAFPCCSATRRWLTFLLMDSMHSLQALYGGTFDPVHYGHLKPVEILANLIGLQRVTIMPNNVPPHRPQPEATSEQRKEMLALAIADKPLFDLDKRELTRTTPSWTVDTLETLRAERGAQPAARLYHRSGFSAQLSHLASV